MTLEEAIKVIEGRFEIMDYCESARLEEALDIAVESLKQPQPRKKGKWIKKEPTIKELHGFYYECSKCHKFSLPFQKLNFCPNCGSYNGGEEDE